MGQGPEAVSITAEAESEPRRRHVHLCYVCDENAYFGFNTANGTVWGSMKREGG
jgi:hypothetical protein